MSSGTRDLSTRDPGFGVYIHWPFCAQKCPYCDFNSHVRHKGWDEDRFLAAYKRELDYVAGMTGPRIVQSIFFGGGTPSLMKPATVGAILDHIAKLWPVDKNCEITIEANPGSVEAARFQGYRAAGINRVSMGLQSLKDDELKKLGRIHTVAESKAALKIARRSFERFSFDLIYARPGQKPDDWRAELTEALDLAENHISLYQLTIEPDTPYAALHAAGKLIVPDPDAALALYEITQELTEARGLAAYEISNHARPGDESRHNLLYWRYGEYAGVGPGAHGRVLVPSHAGGNRAARPCGAVWESPSPLMGEGWGGGGAQASRLGDTPLPNPPPRRAEGSPSARWGTEFSGTSNDSEMVRIATVTEKNPESWLARVEEHGHGFTERTEVTRTEQADEMLLMGLRLREGVDLARLAALGGVAPSKQAMDGLIALGLLERLPAAPLANWRSNELEPITMCLGPGERPEHATPDATDIIRATPKGRFVLNAVVAELSKSFAPLAAPSPMDNPRNAL